MKKIQYDRGAAVAYAEKWALARNPRYYNFEALGGDCTNFASQCLFAGSGVMNYTQDIGWYYRSANDRAAAWTDAQYFHQFLTKNQKAGPFAVAVPVKQVEVGDFIQFYRNGEFYHTLIVTGFLRGEPLVCAHSADVYRKLLGEYYGTEKRGLHILGVNK